MDLKKAKNLLNDMLDLCAMLEDDQFNETCTGIYNDTKAARSIEDAVNIARELMVFADEQNWNDFSDVKEELDAIFNNFLEEFEEF